MMATQPLFMITEDPVLNDRRIFRDHEYCPNGAAYADSVL